MKKILSITIPSYNAAGYLRNCLDSFCVPEIMELIEVLIVNDGSTDTTKDIAEEYVQKYPNTMKLINKENGGHGSGINTGIKYATGKYFKVVDADDWVDKDGFKTLLEVLQNTDSDIISSRFLWAYDNGGIEETFDTKEENRVPFDGVEYKKEYDFDSIADKLYIKMHNMTIKTSILWDNHITIDEHCFYVDVEYILYPIPYVHTVEFIDTVVYMYRLGRAGQSMNITMMQRNLGMYQRVLAAILRLYDSYKEEPEKSDAKLHYIENLIARVYASMVKIVLSLPDANAGKAQFVKLDKELQQAHPGVYDANINRAITALRMSHYILYKAVAVIVKRKYS